MIMVIKALATPFPPFLRAAVSMLALSTALVMAGCAPHSESPTVEITDDDGMTASGAYLAGSEAYRVGDFGVAGHYLERALTVDPDNIDLLRQTFLVETGEGRTDRSVALAHRVILVEPQNAIASLVLMIDDLKSGRLDAADKRLADLPHTGINNLLTPMTRAWVAAGKKDAAGAYAQLQPLSSISSFAMLHDLHIGLIADQLGDDETAKRAFHDLLDADSEPPYRIMELVGNYLERHGEADRAKQLYDLFQTKNPDTLLLGPAFARIAAGQPPAPAIADAQQGMAEAMFDISFVIQHEKPSDQLALITTRLALSLEPNFPLGELLLADVLESQGRGQDAIVAYQSIPPDSVFRWNARLRVAAAEDAAGNTDQAIAELRQMSQENTDRIDALAELGDVLRSHDRFEEAVTAYNTALSRVPKIGREHWSLLFNRAIALERTGDIPAAETDLKRALEFEPEQPYMLNYLGYIWVEHGIHLDQARTMIEKAVGLRPNDGSIVDSLGWAYYQGGDFKGAVRYLERAAELRPHDPTINDHLGDAYWQVGRKSEAQTQWQRALSLDADPPLRAAITHKLATGPERPKTAEHRL